MNDLPVLVAARRRILAATLALLPLALLPLSAAAAAPGDWPTWRHDLQRSGRSGLSGSFDAPAPAWSLDTGGTLTPATVLLGDLDGFAPSELVVVRDGRVLAHSPDGRLLWDTPWLGASSLLSADLDGDGSPDIVALRSTAPTSLSVIDGLNGRIRWTSPPMPPAVAGLRRDTVRLVDLDGDGRRDLLFVPAKVGRVFAYRQTPEGGFAELWGAEYAGYYNFNPPVAGDLDGDGRPEVAFPAYQDVIVLAGEDGSLQHRLARVLHNHAYDHLEIADLAGDAVPELLLVGRAHGHSLTVVDGRAGAVVWALDWTPPAQSALLSPVRPLGDVDGDGRPELVVGVYNDRAQEQDAESEPGDHDGVDAPDVWSLLVLDGSNGRALAHLEGWVPEALADLDGDGRAEILARAAPPGFKGPPRLSTLRVLAFTAAGSLAALGELEQAALVPVRDEYPPGLHDMAGTRPLVTEAGPLGPASFFVVRDEDGDGREDSLVRCTLQGGQLDVVASTALSAELERSGLAFLPAGEQPGPAGEAQDTLVLGRNDGWLELRGQTLDVVASLPLGGSHTPRLVVATLPDEATPRLYHTTAVGDIEARGLAQPANEPPPLLWRYPAGISAPFGVDPLPIDGRTQLLAQTRSSQGVMGLVALDAASGEEIWRSEPPGSWWYAETPLPALLGAQQRPAVLLRGISTVQAGEADLRIAAFDRSTGELLWDTAPTVNTYGSQPLLVADVDGDGGDEVIHVDSSEVEILDGVTGLSLDHRGCEWCKHPLLADLDGDGLTDFFAGKAEQVCLWSGGPRGPEAWCADKRYRDEGARSYPAVARAAADAAELHLLFPAEDAQLSAWQGRDGELAWRRRLTGGEALPLVEAGVCSLSDVVVADLDGGGDDEVLVGSEDGFLYLLAARDGELRWSYDLGALPVELAVAGVGEDGEAAVLVGTANGRIQMLHAATLDPPRVREVALDDQGQPDAAGEDIDRWDRLNLLAAAWDPVPGASSYQVALVTANGLPVVPWTQVGAATSWLLQPLRLLPGRFYRVQVVASGVQGDSPPGSSDGVTIVDGTPPEVLALEALPPVFNPTLHSTDIHALARDRTELESWELLILDGDGLPVRAFGQRVQGPELELHQDWAGDDEDGVPVADGGYGLLFTVTDGAGHTAQAEGLVEVDTRWPLPPVVTLPAAGARVPGDTLLAGTAEAQMLVLVLEGELQLCAATASPAGGWECQPHQPLQPGEHTVTALAVSRSGTRSLPSAPVTFTVEPEGPGDAGADGGGGEDGGHPPDDLGPEGDDLGSEGDDLGSEGDDLGSGEDDLGLPPPLDAGLDGRGPDHGLVPPDSDDGCWCRAAGPVPAAVRSAWWPLLLGAALLGLRRMR